MLEMLKRVPIVRRFFEIGLTMLFVVMLSAIVGLILAFPVMWLWNFVFKNFQQMYINVFQAWALNVLCGILFGKSAAEKSE